MARSSAVHPPAPARSAARPAAGKPSLTPAAPATRKATTPDPDPDPAALSPSGIADLPLPADQRDHLATLIAEYRALQLQEAALEAIQAKRKEVGAEIEMFLLAADVPTLVHDNLRVTRVEVKGRRTLSQDLLLQHGVDPVVIADSYTTGKPSSYVRVTPADPEREAAIGEVTTAARSATAKYAH
jgi:hypothetical protein